MTSTRTDGCQVLLEQLSAYLDGDLPAPACRTIDEHARTCRRCTGMIEELRRTVGLCQQAAARPLPDAVRRRARARVQELLTRRNPRPSRRR